MRNLKFLALLLAVAILSPLVWAWLRPRLFTSAAQPQPSAPADGPADDDPAVGGEDDVAPPFSNPLFRGIGQILDSSPVFEGQEEKDQLLSQVEQADAILRSIKEENRKALARAKPPARRAGSRPSPQRLQRRAPNILVFDLASVQPGDLSCYGQDKYRTPIIDLLAAQGVRFDAFYRASSNSPFSFLSGRRELASETSDRRLPAVLSKAGYTTSTIGVCDFHPLPGPQEVGFDDWFGFTSWSAAHQQFPEQLQSQEGAVRLLANLEGDDRQDAQQVLVSETISFLESQKTDRPFFLYAVWPLPNKDWKAPEQWRSAWGQHVGNLRRVDHDLGLVIRRLNELRLSQNSLVLITSLRRNGERSLKDESLRAPLIVVGPGRVRQDAVSRHLCDSVDLFSSVLEMSTLARSQQEEGGLSFTAELVGKEQPAHEYLAWENDAGDRALRAGKWKGVRRRGAAKLELYDLEEDPTEQVNVAGRHPVEVTRIKQHLHAAFVE